MNLVSPRYAAFVLLVYFIYLLLNHKRQNWLLLIASYLFYAFWNWRFPLLILTITTCDYFCARAIERSDDKSVKRRFVLLSACVDLSILGFFKYCGFFVDNFVALFNLVGLDLSSPTLNIILPVGISFYTFQSLCYTIDVYRGQVKAERNFLDYALYVSFFPQLLAGPIERATNLLPQIREPRRVGLTEVQEGFVLIYWGVFKKVFIADNLAQLIGMFGTSAPDGAGYADGGLVVASTYAFMFQVYADFSAYSDIARGTARLMGFRIMNNFKSPFFAPNVQEVIGRWHISLVTWVMDYIYYPLALTRWSNGKKHLSVNAVTMVTFVIMGFWHGPSWNFALWGFYYSLALISFNYWRLYWKRRRRVVSAPMAVTQRALATLVTFHVCALGFLLFKTPSVGEYVWTVYCVFVNFSWTAQAAHVFTSALFYIWPLLLVDLYQYKRDKASDLLALPAWLRYSFFYVTLYLLAQYGAGAVTFYYFQF